MTSIRSRMAAAADAVVHSAVPDVPGVVAGLTDRDSSFYLGAGGVRSLATGAPMTTDTVFAVFSTTKAVTSTAALQLVEEGLLDLAAPVRDYVPAIAELQVITGFDRDGARLLRPPRTEITATHLLLHTAGFGYDFFNPTYARLARDHGQPSIAAATRKALATPLLFDPGTRWEYGSGIDWLGQVIEAVTGRRLREVIAERICAPLAMTDTTFSPAAVRDRLAAMHLRCPDGSVRATGFTLPEPEIDMGGHGLFATVGDYLRFLRMWLNDGATDQGEQILRPETVRWAAASHLEPGQRVTRLPGVIASLSHDLEFFPGLPKSWGLGFMINDEDAPTGRSAGSLAWAGLANLYFWIDRRLGIGGFWASQLFPFLDPSSLQHSLDFETATYRVLRGC